MRYSSQKLSTSHARFICHNHIHHMYLCVTRIELNEILLIHPQFMKLYLLKKDFLPNVVTVIEWFFILLVRIITTLDCTLILNFFKFICWNYRRRHLSTSVYQNKINSLFCFISHYEKLQKCPCLQVIYADNQSNAQLIPRIIVMIMGIFLDFRWKIYTNL